MKCNKLLTASTIVLVLLFGVFGAAYALVSGPPIQDTHTNVNSPTTSYGNESQLWATLSGDPGGNCTVSRRVYLKWNLADAAGDTVESAALTLTRGGPPGSTTTSYQVGLFKVDDNWNEDSTWNTAPSPGDLIEQQPFPTMVGDTVVFDSSALVNYLQDEILGGDGAASFVVQLVSSAPCAGATTVTFDSRTATNPPELEIFNSNAITLNTFRAADGRISPLIWGAALLGLVALAGAVVARRRMAS